MGRFAFPLALCLLVASTGVASPKSRRNLHRTEANTAEPSIMAESGTSTPRAFGGSTPYHNGDTLRCSDCHVMHASEQHAWDGSTVDFPRTNPPNDELLRHGDPLDLCLSCHDGRVGVPDVTGIDANSLTERSAGYFAAPEEQNHRGHRIGRSLERDQYCERCHFAGEFATAAVTCIDCHAHHGNDRVRNLQWVSAPGSEPQFAMVMRAGATGMAKYERANVGYGYVAGQAREVTNICIDCHHTFFDDSGGWYTNPDGDDHWNRHPNFNSEWGAVAPISAGTATDAPHWMGGVGSGFNGAERVRFVTVGATDFDTATTVDATKNAVFCLSCHKAHGSDHSFALNWDPQTVPRPKGCDQCHAVMEP